jgi:sporulation protein YlmC with PRC-barrel domain
VSTIRGLRGDDVAARDGVVGSVEDVVFDQASWAVRYLVVDTGAPGRRLLVPPAAVERGLSGKHKLRLGLTAEQLEGSIVEQADEERLTSGTEVIGYRIEARDGALGEVQDLIVDEDAWAIRDVVVDTRPWWPGGHVQVHPAYVERIDREARKVHLRLTREQVKRSGAVTPRR